MDFNFDSADGVRGKGKEKQEGKVGEGEGREERRGEKHLRRRKSIN